MFLVSLLLLLGLSVACFTDGNLLINLPVASSRLRLWRRLLGHETGICCSDNFSSCDLPCFTKRFPYGDKICPCTMMPQFSMSRYSTFFMPQSASCAPVCYCSCNMRRPTRSTRRDLPALPRFTRPQRVPTFKDLRLEVWKEWSAVKRLPQASVFKAFSSSPNFREKENTAWKRKGKSLFYLRLSKPA